MLVYAITLVLGSSLAAAQQGDGGTATGNIPATSTNGDVAGAAGTSTGIVKLSNAATIAIAVVVSIVCVLGIFTAVLFFQAKKRQWTMKETLRRSTRRVTTGLKSVMTPLTPHRTMFSPGATKTKFSNSETRGVRGQSPRRNREKRVGMGIDMDMQSLTGHSSRENRDLEKGEASRVAVTEKRPGHKPQMPSITIPKTGKHVDNAPKTPMMNKIFGRE